MNSRREGVSVRLFEHGNGNYYVELARKGFEGAKKTVRISLKTKDKALAQRLFRKLKRQALVDRLRWLEGTPQSIPLQDFIEEYLEFSLKSKAKFTHQTDCVAFRQFLKTFPGSINLAAINAKAVEQWYISLKVKRVSANVWLRHLKAAFTKAVDWNYLKSNPFKAVKILKPDEVPDRYIPSDILHKVVDAETDLSWRLLWLFLVETGVRRSEALQVKAPNDLSAKFIELRAKGGKVKRVFLTESVKLILQQHPVEVGALWPYKPDSVSHHFEKTCKKIGVKARLHDLRHTYASNLAMQGVDLRVVQRLLGHADFKTTLRYEHLTPGYLEVATKLRQTDERDA